MNLALEIAEANPEFAVVAVIICLLAFVVITNVVGTVIGDMLKQFFNTGKGDQ